MENIPLDRFIPDTTNAHILNNLCFDLDLFSCGNIMRTFRKNISHMDNRMLEAISTSSKQQLLREQIRIDLENYFD